MIRFLVLSIDIILVNKRGIQPTMIGRQWGYNGGHGPQFDIWIKIGYIRSLQALYDDYTTALGVSYVQPQPIK